MTPDQASPIGDEKKPQHGEPRSGPDLARLFVAVPLAEATRAALAQLSINLQKGFHFTACRPSWAAPETIHVTLAFLGSKPRAMIEPMCESLGRVAARFSPLVIEVKGLGVFPGWPRPRVLWAGLRERTHQLEALHQAVENALVPFDYEPEAREYHPHLTLARYKSPRGANETQQIIQVHRDFRCKAFDAPMFALFESRLDPAGAQHFLIRSFDFTKVKDSAQNKPALP